VDILKVASCSATDWPLLEAIADTQKPVIISTGGLTIYDIDKIASFFTHKHINFALMHCIALYPSPNETLHMNFMEKMKRRFPYVPVGYSGHEAPDNVDVVKVAVSKGAAILERHVGVPTETITLNKYSMNPDQALAWVESALIAKAIVGEGQEKQISQPEIESLLSLKRGVFAARTIKKGDQIKREDVFFAMPCLTGQTTSGEFGQKRATIVASKDYKRNEAIYESVQPDTIGVIRNIIHDAKGMIFEANIQLGNDFEIELSHHYGMERFREFGALIVNVLNREYCKKLLVLLPNQKHPNHRHKIKEETFQLLWGDFEVVLNDTPIFMKPGDKLLVERGAWHSFTSKGGAIVEEISTTHVKGDSEYEDAIISRLDPIERKTIIEDW
jgi:N-acetylneuraminate synthase